MNIIETIKTVTDSIMKVFKDIKIISSAGYGIYTSFKNHFTTQQLHKNTYRIL